MAVRKLRGSRIGTVTFSNFSADRGTIFYDDVIGEIRIGDGVTPGGLRLKLPIASNVAIGGVMLGPQFSISNTGVLSITSNVGLGSGTLSATGDGGDAGGGFYMLASLDGGHA